MTSHDLRIARRTITYINMAALTTFGVDSLITGGSASLVLFVCGLSLVGVGFLWVEIRWGGFRV